MQRPLSPGWRARSILLLLAIASIGAVCASCAPAIPTGPTPLEQLCTLWDDIVETPPAADEPVDVGPNVLAYADDADVVGGSCRAPAARIGFDSAILSEDRPGPADVVFEDDGLSDPDEPVPAARALVNGEDLGPGQLVLESVALNALGVSVDASGITINGAVALGLDGVTSTIGFSGRLSSLDDWSVTLSSSTLTIPGISSSPVVFSGTLRAVRGVPSLNLVAHATDVTIRDIAVHSAEIRLAASPATGVAASVQGSIRIGTSSVAGVVSVEFDGRGNLVQAHANLTTRLVGLHVGGTTVDLAGTVRLDGNADETTISFTASGVINDMIVQKAQGSLELGEDYARFTGVLDVELGPNAVRVHGALVWDGVTAYVEELTAEADGEYSGTLADGQLVTADGRLELVMVDGWLRTVVTGDFSIGNLRGSGSAVVEVVGATTVLEITAALSLDEGITADVTGVVEITDGRAGLVRLDAEIDAEDVQLGDLTLGETQLAIRSSGGSSLDVTFTGDMRIDDAAQLDGTLTASFGPTGELLSLTGDVDGTFDLDLPAADIRAEVDLTATGRELHATLTNVVVALEKVTIAVDGDFSSSLGKQDWVLKGTGVLDTKVIDVSLRRVIVTPRDGIVSVDVRADVGVAFVFGDLQFHPSGDCRFIVARGGPIARLVAKRKIREHLGCSWHRRERVDASQSWIPES